MRFRFIEDRRADYPVTILCNTLGVSPAGYYAWRSRPESRRSAANRDLADDIKRVHRDTNGRYGSPRIHAELKAQGRGVSRGRMADRRGVRGRISWAALIKSPTRNQTTLPHIEPMLRYSFTTIIPRTAHPPKPTQLAQTSAL